MRPLPIPDFRQVVAILLDIVLMFDELAFCHAAHVGALLSASGNTFYHIDEEMEAVKLI